MGTVSEPRHRLDPSGSAAPPAGHPATKEATDAVAGMAARAVAEYDAPPATPSWCVRPQGPVRPVTPSRLLARDFERRRITQVIVVAPSTIMRRQWADAARGVRAQPRPAAVQPVRVSLPDGMHGYVTTYAR